MWPRAARSAPSAWLESGDTIRPIPARRYPQARFASSFERYRYVTARQWTAADCDAGSDASLTLWVSNLNVLAA